MNPYATLFDLCANCGCPRWRHKKAKRWGHCKKCKSIECKQFRWSPKKDKYIIRRYS